MLNPADRSFQQDIERSLRRALTGLRLSEDEAGRLVWRNRVTALATLAEHVYGEGGAEELFSAAAQASGEQVDSLMGALYVALSDAAREAHS